jgi:hypothetical protein
VPHSAVVEEESMALKQRLTAMFMARIASMKHLQRRLKDPVDASSSHLNRHNLNQSSSRIYSETCPRHIKAQALYRERFPDHYREAYGPTGPAAGEEIAMDAVNWRLIILGIIALAAFLGIAKLVVSRLG